MNQRITTALKNFGLSENEIKVYIEALKYEETSPYALSKATGVPRTTVYDILMDLSLKGLVELQQSDGLQKQQTKIKAKNPSVIRTILEQKRQELTNTEVDIVNILPSLQDSYMKDHQSADFQFFPGIEGVRKVYFSNETKNQPIIFWENMMPMDVFGSQDMNLFTERETRTTLKKGISHRELIPLTRWTKHVLSYQYALNPDYIRARQIRYIDNPLFDNHLALSVQGKHVKIACAHQDEVYGLIITTQTLANTLTALFEVQWLTAKPISKDLIESWGQNPYYQAEQKQDKK